MIDLLYRINDWSLRLQSFTPGGARLVRAIVKLLANSVLPIYYWLSSNNKEYRCGQGNGIIVSMTSYPARISRVWIVIESIFHQSLKADKIVLWLSDEQFPNGIQSLPKSLIRRIDRGLEIRFVNGDIRSHKKYYYCFEYYWDKIIMLVDDDIFYPTSLLLNSYKIYIQNRDSVVANFGFEYSWDERAEYINMVKIKAKNEKDGLYPFFGSGGGTMMSLRGLSDYLDTPEVIMELCPTADDIYLNGITRLAQKKVLLVNNHNLITLIERGTSLLEENGAISTSSSHNGTQFHNFVLYCENKYGRNPFKGD